MQSFIFFQNQIRSKNNHTNFGTRDILLLQYPYIAVDYSIVDVSVLDIAITYCLVEANKNYKCKFSRGIERRRDGEYVITNIITPVSGQDGPSVTSYLTKFHVGLRLTVSLTLTTLDFFMIVFTHILFTAYNNTLNTSL